MKEKIFDEKFKTFMRGFLGIFTYFALNLAAAPILNLIGINVSELSKKQSIFISMCISLIVLAILIFLSWKTLKIIKAIGKSF